MIFTNFSLFSADSDEPGNGVEYKSSEENLDPSSDSNSDFESQSQRLKEEEKKKNDQQDLSKMTLRQKQVYLQQISQQESNNINLEGQTGLYSLESLGPKPHKSEIPRRVRKHKTITLEEQTENQRKALSKILEEMNRREKERDERQKQQKATRDK